MLFMGSLLRNRILVAADTPIDWLTDLVGGMRLARIKAAGDRARLVQGKAGGEGLGRPSSRRVVCGCDSDLHRPAKIVGFGIAGLDSARPRDAAPSAGVNCQPT